MEKRRWSRNFTWDTGGDTWEFNSRALVSKPCSQKDEWDGNTTPHSTDNNDIQKWHTGGGMKEGKEDVEKEKDEESQTREEDGSDNCTKLPLTPTEGLVNSAGSVSIRNSAKNVEDQDSQHEGSSAGGR
mmetsp:Transcript_15158/g.21925  ORF Transcript_15158/g.21925 Transcript_15158/m.21925 type:complete len:129 (-) Transcript_15158:1158-1544(-)